MNRWKESLRAFCFDKHMACEPVTEGSVKPLYQPISWQGSGQCAKQAMAWLTVFCM